MKIMVPKKNRPAKVAIAANGEPGRPCLKPPLTAAAYPAESGRWSVIRGWHRPGAPARARCVSVLRWGLFHSRSCGRHTQPNTVRAPDGAVASPSACAGTALSPLLSPSCVGAPLALPNHNGRASTLLRTRRYFIKKDSQSGFLLFEISSPYLKSASK